MALLHHIFVVSGIPYTETTRAEMKGQSSGAVRFVLGMMQMAAATVAAVLLWQTGVNTWTLVFVVTACVLTTVSVLVFGAGPRLSDRPDGRRER